MKTFELEWSRYPLNFNTRNVAKVEAENEDDAKELLRDAIKDRIRIADSEFGILKCKEYVPLTIKGKVTSLS